MTNAKTTKRAFLTSVVSLLICFSMLLGTTFAWFTDSVISEGNVIKSGTLKVKLLMWDGNSYESIDGNAIFEAGEKAQNGTETLWEPGKTQVVYLAIKNAGSLDLKYSVALNVTNTKANEANGKKLTDVLQYTITPDVKDGKGVDAWDGTNAKSVAAGTQKVADSVALESGVTHYFALSVHMLETASDDYQGLEVKFDLTVLATQLASEEDSFDNQYDADAIFYDKLVTTDAELKAAVQDPDVKTIAIKGDLTYDWGDVTDGATALKGITLVGYNGTADSITFRGLGSDNDISNVNLKNITVSDSTISATENNWEYTYLEFNSLTANNVVFKNGILLKGYSKLTDCSVNSNANEYGVWILDGNATLNNCTFTGARGVKIHEQYATNGRDNNVETVVIDGCTFMNLSEKPGVAIDSDNDTQITIKNSTFINCQAGENGDDDVAYIYETKNTVPTLENNTVKKDAPVVSTTTALQDAINGDADTIILESGEYGVIDVRVNRTLTITAAVGAEVKIAGINGYNNNTSKITIKGVTIDNSLQTEGWFYGTSNDMMPCVGVNGGDYTFENCTFYVTGESKAETGIFSVNTANNGVMTFTNCTFNGGNDSARAMQIYGNYNLNVTGCTFNTAKNYSIKYVGESGTKATFKNNTVNATTNFVQTGSALYAGENYSLVFENNTLAAGINHIYVDNAEGQTITVNSVSVPASAGNSY